MSGDDLVRAAGGIVVRDDGGPCVAIVHRPRYDDWSFPKGKVVGDESDEETALREVREETGLSCRLDAPAGEVAYRDRSGRPKLVRYWRMTPERGSFSPTDEVDELRWVRPDEAEDVLTYEHDRVLFRSLELGAAASPIYVVRHAKAGRRDRWDGPDLARPLSGTGRRQAERLVERFRGVEIARIVSSPYVRCVETVEPLAGDLGLDVEVVDALAEGADLSSLFRFVGSLDGRPTVLCGHGTEIDALIGRLADEGVHVDRDGGLAKGSVWVLDRDRDGFVSARYEPAPSA